MEDKMERAHGLLEGIGDSGESTNRCWRREENLIILFLKFKSPELQLTDVHQHCETTLIINGVH